MPNFRPYIHQRPLNLNLNKLRGLEMLAALPRENPVPLVVVRQDRKSLQSNVPLEDTLPLGPGR